MRNSLEFCSLLPAGQQSLSFPPSIPFLIANAIATNAWTYAHLVDFVHPWPWRQNVPIDKQYNLAQ